MIIYSQRCGPNCKRQAFDLYQRRPVVGKTFRSAQLLFKYYPCSITIYKKSDQNTVLGGIMWWQTRYGNKISTSFAVSNSVYREHVLPLYIHLLRKPGYYAELSGALSYLVFRKLNQIKNTATIKRLTGAKDDQILKAGDPRIERFDSLRDTFIPEGSYLRNIQGIGPVWKTLYGKPCMDGRLIGHTCHLRCTKSYIEDSNNNDSSYEPSENNENTENEASNVDLSLEANNNSGMVDPNLKGGLRCKAKHKSRKRR